MKLQQTLIECMRIKSVFESVASLKSLWWVVCASALGLCNYPYSPDYQYFTKSQRPLYSISLSNNREKNIVPSSHRSQFQSGHDILVVVFKMRWNSNTRCDMLTRSFSWNNLVFSEKNVFWFDEPILQKLFSSWTSLTASCNANIWMTP